MNKSGTSTPPPKGGSKHLLLKLLIALGLYPHIFFRKSPFKIYEFLELLRGTPLAPDDTVLDIGCGRSLQTFLLAQRGGKAVGVDIEIPERAYVMLEHYLAGRIDCELRRSTLEDAGFAAETFDKVFSICVLEHIPNNEEVLREAYRVLKPGGRLAISVDSMAALGDPELEAKHMADHHVVKYFDPDELRAFLESCGFREVEVYPIFVSDYAKRLFTRKLWDWKGASLPRAIFQWMRLRHHERRAKDRAKGLFLIARGVK